MANPLPFLDVGPDHAQLERRLAGKLKVWRGDTKRFMGEALGVQPTPQQEQVLVAYNRGDKRISIKSGHGIGKSAIKGTCCWHRLCTYGGKDPSDHPRVPITAPTKHQLEDVLWAEIASWHGRMEPWLSTQFDVRSDAVRHKRHPKTWFAVGRTGRKESPDALQGFHGKNLLFLADEASGIPAEVFHPISGALTGENNQIIMSGNPLWLLGFFYESFHRNRNKWTNFTFSSEDSPLVDAEWVEDMADTYGREGDIFRVRVLGEFPKAAAGQLISIDLVEAAMARTYSEREILHAPRILTADVARQGGDASVIGKRQGLMVWDIEKFKGDRALDTMALAGRIAGVANEWDPHMIGVDMVGIGAGVVDRLYQLNFGDVLIPINGGVPAADDKRFYNLRAEMWWKVKEWLEIGGALPNDMELRDDLIGPMYQFDLKGRIQLERKRDMKKRGLASPDIGDMIAQSFVQEISPSVQTAEDKLVRAIAQHGEEANTNYDPMRHGM